MKEIIVIDSIHFFRSFNKDLYKQDERYVIFNNFDELKKLIEILPYDLYSKSYNKFQLFDFMRGIDIKIKNNETCGFIVLKSLGDPECFISRVILDFDHVQKDTTYNKYISCVSSFKNEANILKDLKDNFPENISRKERTIYLAKIYESRKRLNQYAYEIKKARFEKNKSMSKYDKQYNSMYGKKE